MSTTLSQLEREQKFDVQRFVQFGLGYTTGQSVVVTGSVPKANTLLNSFDVYREQSGTSIDPCSVRGGYYGSKVRRSTVPQSPVDLVERVTKAAAEEPKTRHLIERTTSLQGDVGTSIGGYEFQLREAALRALIAMIGNVSLSPSKWGERLDSFASLVNGWDSYKASPPSKEALEASRRFLGFLEERSLEPSKLNPSVVGGVGFTFRRGRLSVYIEFCNTGNAHAMFTDGKSKPRVVKVRQDGAGYEDILTQLETHLHELPAAPAGDGDEKPRD